MAWYKLVNSLPPLPDDLIETVRQLNDDGDGVQWAMGDLLVSAVEELGPAYASIPELGSLRRARTYILRQLADRTGVDESTLRDRQNVCEFFPPKMRLEYDGFTFHQWRAFKYAGGQWRKYAEQAAQNLPAPVRVIRAWIRDDKNEVVIPAWERMLDKFIDIAYSLERDEAAPGWVRQAAHFVVEASKDWRSNDQR